jgi:Flp pilus assembly protein TadD
MILSQSDHVGGTLAQQAQGAFEAGRFSEACDKLKQALKLDPHNAALWSDLGVSYTRLNQIERAIAAFQKALSISPKNSQILFTVGILYTQKGEVEEALRAYKQGLALEPANEAANQNYALLLMRTGRYKAAVEPLQRLKKTKNSDLSVRAALVEAYVKSGLKTEGEGELDEILKSSIASDSDKLRIANLLLEDQEPDAAKEVLERTASNQPDSAPAFWKLGLLFSKESRYNDATHAVRRAIELDPSASEYMRTMAELLLEAKRPWDAVNFLLSIKDRFGTVPDFQYKLGLAYYQAGLFNEAIAEFQGLAQDYPQRPESQFYIGNCYKAMGQFEKADASYRLAIELKPGEAQYYTFLADTLRQEALLGTEKTAKTNEVIKLFERALELDPTDTNAQVELALCYEKKGNLEKAESLLADAVRREPALRRAHLLLARIYGREGKTELAARESQLITRLQAAEQEKRSGAMRTTSDGNR